MATAPIYYPGAIVHNSPWQNNGPAKGRDWPNNVTIAVQHHTDGSEESVLGTFGPNSERQVSAHLMITRTGKVHQFVSFANIAWHAGDWTANVHSIGIEHEQSRTQNGWQSWPRVQLETSAKVQNWLKQYMPAYKMEPHHDFTDTSCPGDLPITQIQQLMQKGGVAVPVEQEEWTDPATGIKIIGGMYARWKQVQAQLGNEIFLLVGHPTHPEEKQPDGSIEQKFEHTIWRWRKDSSPERFDILADIIYPAG